MADHTPPQARPPKAPPPKAPHSSWTRWLVSFAKWTLFALVVWGLWHAGREAIGQWQNQPIEFAKVQPFWLVVAGASYVGGLTISGEFWHRVLWAMGQQPTRRESLSAYWMGHVGKYVPGKALVVVIRATMVCSPRTDAAIAGLGVIVETLVMMAAGGFLAAAILFLGFRHHQSLQVLAMALMLVTGFPVIPPIFRQIVRTLQATRIHPNLDAAVGGINWRLMATGWCLQTSGWLLLGFSLWAIIRSLPGGAQCGLRELPRTVASASLAIVAGFLSLLPGGILVREWVLDQLLKPQFNPVLAMVAVILMRGLSLVCELVMATSSYLVKRRWTKTSSV